MSSDVCKHCNKGARHFTEWDFPEGTSQCRSYHRYGGCVGDWTCLLREQDEKPHDEPKEQVETTDRATLEREIMELQDQLSDKIKQLSTISS